MPSLLALPYCQLIRSTQAPFVEKWASKTQKIGARLLGELTPVRSASDNSETKSLVAMAYGQLRSDIIEGRLEPGSRLRVEHLKDNYNVSAGTLREALGLLVSDALVVVHDQRGFRVAPISIEDYHDITETRVTLETDAIRRSIANATVEWEGELSSAYHQLRRAEENNAVKGVEALGRWEECNRRFHRTLLANCQSNWTLRFLTILYKQSERYRRISLTNWPVKRRAHDEHAALFKAALDHDSEKAAEILCKHLWATYDAVKSLADKGQINGLSK